MCVGKEGRGRPPPPPPHPLWRVGRFFPPPVPAALSVCLNKQSVQSEGLTVSDEGSMDPGHRLYRPFALFTRVSETHDESYRASSSHVGGGQNNTK